MVVELSLHTIWQLRFLKHPSFYLNHYRNHQVSAAGKIWNFPANLTPYFKIEIIIISGETTFFLEQEPKKKKIPSP